MHRVLSQWVIFFWYGKKYKIQNFLIIFKVENASSLEKIWKKNNCLYVIRNIFSYIFEFWPTVLWMLLLQITVWCSNLTISRLIAHMSYLSLNDDFQNACGCKPVFADKSVIISIYHIKAKTYNLYLFLVYVQNIILKIIL